MTTEENVRADICEVGRRLYAQGYVASNDGNVSVRLDDERIMTTPTGVSKGFMTPDMMVIVDAAGKKISGERNASSELKMHLAVYEMRPDVRSVVHAHPPTATGFAVAGIPLDRAVLAEVICMLGSIPIAEYATPSTTELPDAVRKYIRAHDGLLLANHGALTCCRSLFSAYYKMETVEHFAKISLVARQLGGERVLSREEVVKLQSLRDMYGISSPAGICFPDPADPQAQGGECQVVRAPVTEGERLVSDRALGSPSFSSPFSSTFSGLPAGVSADTEIRLTYRELQGLIEDAIRALR
jgi:L-fuculose-phosphate aldolase